MISLKIKDNIGYLDKAIVERNVKKYFGADVVHTQTDDYKFDGQNHEIVMAGGDPAPMVVVTEMYDNEDGTYTVFFNEVYTYDVDVLDYSATMEDVEKTMKESPDQIFVSSLKKALIKKHDFEGKELYMLISYETVENY